MKRKNYFFICMILCIILVSVPAYAFEVNQKDLDNQTVQNGGDSSLKNDEQVVGEAETWLQENYGEFYDIRNVDATIVRTFETDEKIRYTVGMTCETKYKFNDAYEIPFVKGMLSVTESRSLKTYERKAIDTQIEQISADANFGQYTDLAVDVVIEIDKQNTTAPWKMYYQDGIETTLYDIDVLKLDYAELYDSGKETAIEIVANALPDSQNQTRGYSAYDRFAARNYARQYSSNATSCDIDGSSCGVKQDRSKWNTSDYPYFSGFKHNDCADFVSQALSAGGIPEKSGWYRTKRGANGTWTNSWIQVEGLKAYMTRADHVYWDTSTFAKCNAGNVFTTNSGGHVVMVDFNDGTTHRFTGHTNDRKSYVFAHAIGYLYYVINRS